VYLIMWFQGGRIGAAEAIDEETMKAVVNMSTVWMSGKTKHINIDSRGSTQLNITIRTGHTEISEAYKIEEVVAYQMEEEVGVERHAMGREDPGIAGEGGSSRAARGRGTMAIVLRAGRRGRGGGRRGCQGAAEADSSISFHLEPGRGPGFSISFHGHRGRRTESQDADDDAD
jgi:hypothetical protein